MRQYCRSTIQWAIMSLSTRLFLHHSVGQCVRPSGCPPFSWSVCLPIFRHYHTLGKRVRPLSFNGSVCLQICLPTMHLVSVSSRLSVYHSLGKCVHPAVCLPFIGSVYLPNCLRTIHWVSVSNPLSVKCSLSTVTVSSRYGGSVGPPVCLSTIQ